MWSVGSKFRSRQSRRSHDADDKKKRPEVRKGRKDDALEAEASWMSWRSLDNLHERLHCDLCGTWCNEGHRDTSRHRRRLKMHRSRSAATVSDMLGDTDVLAAASTRGGDGGGISSNLMGSTLMARSLSCPMLRSAMRASRCCASWVRKARSVQRTMSSQSCWSMASSPRVGQPLRTHLKSAWGPTTSLSTPPTHMMTPCTEMSMCIAGRRREPLLQPRKSEQLGEVMALECLGKQLRCCCADAVGRAQLPRMYKHLFSLPGLCRGGIPSSGERVGGGGFDELTVSATIPFLRHCGEASSPKVQTLQLPMKAQAKALRRTRKVDGFAKIRGRKAIKSLGVKIDDDVLAQPLCHRVYARVGGRILGVFLGLQTAWSLGVVMDCCDQIPTLGGSYVPQNLDDLCAYDWGTRTVVNLSWHSSERGGVFDASVREDVDSLIARVRGLESSVRGVGRDLVLLRERLSKRPRLDPEGGTGADGGRGRSNSPPEIQDAETNYDEPEEEDVLTQLFEDQPTDHHSDGREAELPVEDREEVERAGAPPPWREEPLHAANRNGPHGGHDNDDGPPFDHEIIVQMGERARRKYNLSYVEPNASIGDIHFETARVTKRGAMTFELQQHGQTLDGTTVLHTLGKRIHLWGIARAEQVRHLSPRSAKRRGGCRVWTGGAPSSLRAKLSRRLTKHGSKVPEILQLVQTLWPRESRAFTEHRGTTQSLEDLLHAMMQKHGAVYTKDGWTLDKGAPMAGKLAHDPWLMADPWSVARAAGSEDHRPCDTQHALDGESLSGDKAFEQYQLVTRYVTEEGHELSQTTRAEYQTGTSAVVLVDKAKVGNLIALIDGSVSVMIIVNAWHAKLNELWGVVKTQIVVKVKATTKALTAYAAAVGPVKLHAVQQAVKLQVIESQTVVGVIRLRKALCTEEVYEAMQKKENLVKIIGPLIKSVTLTMKRIEEDPPAVRWSFEVTRMYLPQLLKCSGICEATVTVDRAEEQKLGIVPVFVSASAASLVLKQLEGIDHMGVTGPTRSGHYVARAVESQLEQVRKAVLSSTSSYTNQWSLQVKHKYVGRFLRKFGMLSIAESLKTTLKWPCIAVSHKVVSKTHHNVIIGCTDPPPVLQVEIGGEVVILQPMDMPKQDTLATAFAAPSVDKREEGAAAEPLPEAPQSALDQLCDRKVKAMEQQIEQKIVILKQEVKESVELATKGALEKYENAKKEENDQKDHLMQQLKDAAQRQEAQMKEQRANTEAAFVAVEEKLQGMDRQNKVQFEKVEKSLAEHAQALAESSQGFRDQLQAFGSDLMKQIVQMQADANGSSKKRKPGDSGAAEDGPPGTQADMDTRGGMNTNSNTDCMAELASRLRYALARHGLQDDEHGQVKNVKQEDTVENAVREEKHGQNEEVGVVTSEKEVKEPAEPEVNAAPSTQRQQECRDKEEVTKSPPGAREHHPSLLQPAKSVRCTEETCQDVATFLADKWEAAMQKGTHLWILKKGCDVISDCEPLQHLQQAEPAKEMESYHIMCWSCGLVYAASRRKAVQDHGCMATVIAVGATTSKKRAMGRSCAQAIYDQYLKGLNDMEERRAKHWPRQCATPEGARNGPWFRCEKCGLQMCNSKKMRLIEGTCDRQLHRVLQVLPYQGPQRAGSPRGVEEGQGASSSSSSDAAAAGHQQYRAGDITRVASLNVGTLVGRAPQLSRLGCQICALQEVCVAKHKQISMTKALEDVGGSIVYGQVRSEDERTRGRGHHGVRLGTGVAVVAFRPWRTFALREVWPKTKEAELASHRVTSALATDGQNRIIIHVLYKDPQKKDGLQHIIDDLIQQRIRAMPMACHCVAGDWQDPADDGLFGKALLSAGWVSHSSIQEPSTHVTHVPHRGAPRVLDNIYISPNLVASLVASGTEKIAGWSTHMLITMDLRFNNDMVEGQTLRPGLKQSDMEDAVKGADDFVWDNEYDTNLNAAELYREWVRRLNEWMHLPPDRVGVCERVRKVDRCDAKAPVRVRAHWRSNIARKVNAHWDELKAIVDWEDYDSGLPDRAWTLARAISRAPWLEWGAENPFGIMLGRQRGMELQVGHLWQAWYWMESNWKSLHEEIVLSSRHSLQLWKMDLKDSIATGRLKRPGRWLKGHGSLPILTKGDNLLVHPEEVGRELVRAWSEIYSPEEYHGMNEETVKQMIEQSQGVPYCPGPLQPEQLMNMAKKKPISAGGPDSIGLYMLKALPMRAWQMLCLVLNKCEEGDAWPAPLCEVTLAAIPKAGEQTEASALKVRLISLSSHVYRLWSSLRTSQISAAWLTHVVGPGVYGGIRGKSSRMASVLDTMRWEESAADAVAHYSVYLDFSKCFDTIGVRDVLRCARGLGFSERVATALEAWYRQHSRSVTISGWVQAPIYPRRGIMQGCGLSVVLCAVWGSTWSSWVGKLMEDRGPQAWHSTVYMDDYSFSARNLTDVHTILGWTRHHCTAWGVQLNEKKSSILTNERGQAAVEGSHIELAKDKTYKLLGIETGWTASGEYILARLRDAGSLIRRLQSISLPHYLYQKMVSAFVTPTLFGIEFDLLPAGARDLDRQLQQGTWGVRRPATNWPAARTYCVRSHLVTVEGSRYTQLFRTLWEYASHEATRKQCLRIWNSSAVHRQGGFWYAFLHAVADAEAILLPDGGIRHKECDQPCMHLSQGKAAWMHGARQLWRRYNRALSHRKLPEVYPPVHEPIDWICCRVKAGDRSGMIDSVQANALNTKGRVARHFEGDCDVYCEYGCHEEDDFRHRLVACEGTASLRRELSLDGAVMQRLSVMESWVTRAGCVDTT